jgi:hypothetical protein
MPQKSCQPSIVPSSEPPPMLRQGISAITAQRSPNECSSRSRTSTVSASTVASYEPEPSIVAVFDQFTSSP